MNQYAVVFTRVVTSSQERTLTVYIHADSLEAAQDRMTQIKPPADDQFWIDDGDRAIEAVSDPTVEVIEVVGPHWDDGID